MRYVTLGSRRIVTLRTYVRAWRQTIEAVAINPEMEIRETPCSPFGGTVAESLRQFRAAMHERINRRAPERRSGRKWNSQWQVEAARCARAVNTPRLIVRWVPPDFRSRLAHRLEIE